MNTRVKKNILMPIMRMENDGKQNKTARDLHCANDNKTVCEESTDCCICPLKSQNPNFACGLRIKPSNWKIKDYNEYNAFQ